MRYWMVGCLLSAMALGACGSSQSDEAASAVRGYVKAFVAGEHEEACSRLSSEGQANLEALALEAVETATDVVACEDYSRLLLDANGDAGRQSLADVDGDPSDVDLSGDTGLVRFESGTYGVEEVDGGYRVRDPRPVVIYLSIDQSPIPGAAQPRTRCLPFREPRGACNSDGTFRDGRPVPRSP